MPIIVNVDVMMAKTVTTPASGTNSVSVPDEPTIDAGVVKVDLTLANLSILKTGKAKAVRFSTLDAICRALDCQPGDVLEYRSE